VDFGFDGGRNLMFRGRSIGVVLMCAAGWLTCVIGQETPPHWKFVEKMAFLTDGRAISGAETYMGIIEHYKLGAIIGEAAGTNGNVNPFVLPADTISPGPE
jgi:hypothetical protein